MRLKWETQCRPLPKKIKTESETHHFRCPRIPFYPFDSTLEFGDPRMHQDVSSQYVFQEPSKACRLREPAHNISDQIYHQKPNNGFLGYILDKHM